MALPSSVKTWNTHNHNNVVAASGTVLTTNRNMWLALKNGIKAFATGAPTVKYSCDSSVAGSAGDGVDRWSSASNLVWNNAGSAHSWIVLGLPGFSTNASLVLSCEASSGQGAVMTIGFSPIVGHSGGTTTARPTAGDETVIANGLTMSVTTDAQLIWNASLSTDGKCLRFWLWSASSLKFFFSLEVPRNPSSWTSPFMATCLTSSPTVATIGGTSAAWYMRNTTTPVNVTCFGTTEQNGTGACASQQTSVDSDGNWPFFGIGTFCTTAGSIGEKGQPNDMYLGSVTRISSDVYPSSGAPQWGHIGNLIVPVSAAMVIA